jgi:hypothetical protein
VLRLTTIPRPESPALAGSGTVGARAHLRGQCVKSGLPWIVSRAARLRMQQGDPPNPQSHLHARSGCFRTSTMVHRIWPLPVDLQQLSTVLGAL